MPSSRGRITARSGELRALNLPRSLAAGLCSVSIAVGRILGERWLAIVGEDDGGVAAIWFYVAGVFWLSWVWCG